MKSTPILYTAAMVQAMLEDRKNQTRRLRGLEAQNVRPDGWRYDGVNVHGDHLFFDVYAAVAGHDPQECAKVVKCPFGGPTDQVWVKETFRHICEKDGTSCVQYRADMKALKAWASDNGEGDWVGVNGKADPIEFEDIEPPWKPSIFMPRWASRITLEITEVRAERLQDISEEDAIQEGIRKFTKDRQLWKYWSCDPCDGKLKCAWADLPRSAVEAYAFLWDSINAKGTEKKPGQPWNENPWVWRIQFKRV